MSVVEASSDLLLTGFPNEIARNKSIQMLKDLKSTATNLTKEDLEDIQFVIETMTYLEFNQLFIMKGRILLLKQKKNSQIHPCGGLGI